MTDRKPLIKDMTSAQRKAWADIRTKTQSAVLYHRSLANYFFVRGFRTNGDAYDYMITPDGYINDAWDARR